MGILHVRINRYWSCKHRMEIKLVIEEYRSINKYYLTELGFHLGAINLCYYFFSFRDHINRRLAFHGVGMI